MYLKSANKEGLYHLWKLYGTLLEFDDEGAEVETIDKKHPRDCKACCQAMFQHWLSGNGRKPISWRTLIELLEDLDLNVLADEIQNALKVFLVAIVEVLVINT